MSNSRIIEIKKLQEELIELEYIIKQDSKDSIKMFKEYTAIKYKIISLVSQNNIIRIGRPRNSAKSYSSDYTATKN